MYMATKYDQLSPASLGKQRLLHTRFEMTHVNQTHGAEPPISVFDHFYQQKRFILATG
jgi:hypothetical protein